MNLSTMNDQQIIEFIAINIEKKRLSNKISADDLAHKGGYNAQTYSNFINKHTNIKISTLIQILRGLEELDNFQHIIEYKEAYSPMDASSTKLPKRIRNHKKADMNNRSKWGDEK
ncbi:MAG: helix-turn-helix domain-containing protein [Candidatus Cloacimonetes bacterium]|nr:helix-turn-helix domain-containing protein [Candidatus Cloacimonadota bacterium]